ncbi:MAG: DUF1593 domain-containing protein [Prevotellaceae bacterium]|nr:DUF1593 domain-containing protein [Prevotellaceae bacterium]
MKFSIVKYCIAAILSFSVSAAMALEPNQIHQKQKYRILISTDIGGTDPDDNQSFMHYLLYSNEFDCEGLVSSPSYGDGSAAEMIRMIGLYEKDLPVLCQHAEGWPTADYLRSIAKQGRHGAAPMCGYSTATEGSEWIVKCAQRDDERPLYVLVWGGLDDVAQALHDAPQIANKVRIHWIGGPNKKWSLPSYCYIVTHFPNIWFIENNESYRGFIANYKNKDKHHAGFYEYYVKGAGNLGADFYNYKEGLPKLGDTPTLLYMMHGDASVPERESWGGSFEKIQYSSRVVFDRPTTASDTIQRDGIIEWHFKGPKIKKGKFEVMHEKWSSGADNEVGLLTVDKQKWPVYYLGKGKYMCRYATYKNGVINYSIDAPIKGFPKQEGQFFVENVFPGKHRSTDYKLGTSWWSDRIDSTLYSDREKCQGAKTVEKWRDEVMEDWGARCAWFR